MARFPTIRVRSNPYAHLDHEGRPAGVVLFDPVEHLAYGSDEEPRRFVGAAIDLEKTVVYQKAAASSAQSDLQETHFTFDDEPVEVPRNAYYLSAVRSGELLAADEETADEAGIPYVRPADAIEAAKKSAIDRWKTERPKRALPEWAKREAPTRSELRPATPTNEVK